MNRNIIRSVHQIPRLDGNVAEPQVGPCDPAGFLCVVFEVPLGVLVGVIPYDLDGVLVRSHRTVTPDSPEFTPDDGIRLGVYLLGQLQASMCYVVGDAYCEMVLGIVEFEVVEDGLCHGGRELL